MVFILGNEEKGVDSGIDIYEMETYLNSVTVPTTLGSLQTSVSQLSWRHKGKLTDRISR
jgi:hypothetical protein